MQGFVIAEAGHVVNVLPPIDINGGAVGDRFSMSHYAHASIIVQIGVSESAFTAIIVKECTAASGGTATAIAFEYYSETTASGDTLGARTSATSSGVTPSANDNIFYVIELDARELSDGSEWVELSLTNGSTPCIASAVAILSGSRHASVQSPTVLS